MKTMDKASSVFNKIISNHITYADNIEIIARNYQENVVLEIRKSKLLTRNTKMKRICETILRLIVTYGSVLWTVTCSGENMMHMFERKMLRKIKEPKNIKQT